MADTTPDITVLARLASEPRNRWFLIVALLYLLLMLVFAGLYYHLHTSGQDAFAFGDGIAKAQATAVRTETSERFARMDALLAVLNRAAHSAALPTSRVVLNPDPLEIFASSTLEGADRVSYSAECFFNEFIGNDAYVTNIPRLRHDGSTYTFLFTGRCSAPTTTAEFSALLNAWIGTTSRVRNEAQATLSALDESAPPIWSFWDFLYFSAITQATVGYGDILPNSTKVRLWVTFHTVLSALLLSVLLNLSITRAYEYSNRRNQHDGVAQSSDA